MRKTTLPFMPALVALMLATGCKDASRQAEITKDTPVTDTAKDTALLADTVTPAETPENPAPAPCTIEDLEPLHQQIWASREALGKDNPLFFNFHGSHNTKDSLIVELAINTPDWQAQFRKQISDSPRIAFHGPAKPQRIALTARQDEGIRLQPDSTMFPTDAESASFTLSNLGGNVLQFGKPYIVGYQGTDGQWYELPHIGAWEDIGYALRPGGTHTFKAALLPILNRNRPGTYRLYKEVHWAGDKDKFWVMTEFRLGNEP